MTDGLTLAAILSDLGMGRPPTGSETIALRGVRIDSREVEPGDLFVALPGERTDGHQYVESAFEGGALVALVSRRVGSGETIDVRQTPLPEAVRTPVSVLVDDTLRALQTLARARRSAHVGLRVIGVTGSVGKTTTKEAIASVLSQRYRTLRSEGNYNNEIGLPLTLMALRPEHERAVLEMGMYDLGEIALLCGIAAPQIGVITNVEPVHLERLGTIERIAQAKKELVDALPPGGVAILNGDDRLVAGMDLPAGVTRVTFGLDPGNLVRAVDIRSSGLDGVRFVAQVNDLPDLGVRAGERGFRLRTLGTHSVAPALAAVAVGLVEGLTGDEIEAGLLAQGHGLRLLPRRAASGAILLDDTYNASPRSVTAALDLLNECEGRHVAVLGDMLELGASEEEGHRSVGRHCAAIVDDLVVVGRRASLIAEEAITTGLPEEAVHRVDDVAGARAALAGRIGDGDVVLVKGSRSMGLESLIVLLEGQES